MTVGVYVPDETTACALGANEVAAALTARLREIGVQAPVRRNGSRGAFFLEPMAEVDTPAGRIAFGPLTTTTAPAILTDEGQPDRAHPACLGPVDGIEFLARQTRLTFSRAGVIEPLDFEAYVRHGGTRGLKRALTLQAQEIVAEIAASGLRGRGGAAFPAGRKWQTVLEAAGSDKYVVCNADEGDSGTFADRLLMEADPFQLLEGMIIAGLGVGASRGYIYLRSEYPKAHAVVQAALDRARRVGLLGSSVLGSQNAFDIELRLGAGSYICGEETAMLDSIEGKRGMVRKKPPVPAIAGLFGQPTVVNNVLTLAAATTILADGGAAYAALGVNASTGTMPFQLAGCCARGGLVEVPFGLTLNQLIEGFGGGSGSGRPLAAAQIGGPLGAYLPPSQWDLSLDYEAFAEAAAMIGHGGIVLFDETVDMAEQAEFALRFCAEESCGKCTPCRIGSVRGVELVQRIRAGDDAGSDLATLNELLETLELGSLCALGGLTPMPVRSVLRWYPAALGAGAETAERSGAQGQG